MTMYAYDYYCFADVTALQQYMYSEAIQVQSGSTYFSDSFAFIFPNGLTYSGLLSTSPIPGDNLIIQYSTQNDTVTLVQTNLTKFFPYCSTPGPLLQQVFDPSSLDPVAIMGAFTAGASVFFSVFAMAWAVSQVINYIGGNKHG